MLRISLLLLLIPILLGFPGSHPIAMPLPGAIDCEKIIDIDNYQSKHWFPKSLTPTTHYHTVVLRSVCDGDAVVWYRGELDMDGKQVPPWSGPSLPFRLIPEPSQWLMMGSGLLLLTALRKSSAPSVSRPAHHPT